jgi:type I restriction enzyme R subunit
MTVDYKEQAFETELVDALTADSDEYEWAVAEKEPFYENYDPGDYRERKSHDFDKDRCLIPDETLEFVKKTQKDEWDKLVEQFGDRAEREFFHGLTRKINRDGTLKVLREGFRVPGANFEAMAYFKPENDKRPEAWELYEKNILTVVRQLRYLHDESKAPDLTIFLNGLPIITVELKTTSTQTVEDAKKQYKTRRDPNDTLFEPGRCLVHFAVDTDEVYMTTELEGEDTDFLPFNRGSEDNGAGNPPNSDGYKTEYFWNYVLSKDSLMNLVSNFITEFRRLDDEGNLMDEEDLIFPRFHQLDAVRRAVEDTREKGPGETYLVQHSAGSGKTFTISWLAHQLNSLHDEEDNPVFDSVIVISDRTVLDDQLQHHVNQFSQVSDLVKTIDEDSQQLQGALEKGKKIIVTTIHKFFYIVDSIRELEGDDFAVIIDEAHSSQSGELRDKQMQTLADLDLPDDADTQDILNADIESRGPLPNVSSYAFTATPKERTLEMFGHEKEDGGFAPFSLYSMKQAIEEGFIMDVLKNYTSFEDYYRLLKTVDEDPEFKTQQAMSLLKSYVRHHPETIQEKTKVMVEHFDKKVASKIDGKAKTMVVTGSREEAIRLKLAFDNYLGEQGYDYRALCAFSQTKEVDGEEYTERSINEGLNQSVEEEFKKEECRFLIVANKFQTGFDQPLLHTMYVHKNLGGVRAVQTLSRLNRTHPDKDETMVLDFVNDPEKIQKAFKRFYEDTKLSQPTDPHLLYDLNDDIRDFKLFSDEKLDEFIEIWYDDNSQPSELHSCLDPVVERYKKRSDDEQQAFRKKLNDFIRLYSFLTKVVPFSDKYLHTLYQFGRMLYRKLPVERSEKPIEVKDHVDLEDYRLEEIESEEDYSPSEGESEMDPQHTSKDGGRSSTRDPTIEPLSEIIKILNNQTGYDFDQQDEDFIKNLSQELMDDQTLLKTISNNPDKKARRSFAKKFETQVKRMFDQNYELVDEILGNENFGSKLKDLLFDQIQRRSEQDLSERANGDENGHRAYVGSFLNEEMNINSELLKHICAFSNSGGGEVVLGINSEGDLTGIEGDLENLEKNDSALDSWLKNEVKENIDESVAKNLQIERGQKENRIIASILVNESNKPVHLNDDFYVRKKSSSIGLNSMDKKDYLRRYFNLNSEEIENLMKEAKEFD